MRHIVLLATLVLVSCSPPQPKGANDTPSALQERNAVEKVADMESSSWSGRSGYSDLVEALFQDVLEQDTALSALMLDLGDQDEHHADSLQAYERFLGLNRSYYESALGHTQQLDDSITAAAQRDMLEGSQRAYVSLIAPYTSSAETYGRIRSRNSDAVELIKLKRTLPLIEAFQKKGRSYQALWNAEVVRIKELEKRLAGQLK